MTENPHDHANEFDFLTDLMFDVKFSLLFTHLEAKMHHFISMTEILHEHKNEIDRLTYLVFREGYHLWQALTPLISPQSTLTGHQNLLNYPQT